MGRGTQVLEESLGVVDVTGKFVAELSHEVNKNTKKKGYDPKDVASDEALFKLTPHIRRWLGEKANEVRDREARVPAPIPTLLSEP